MDPKWIELYEELKGRAFIDIIGNENLNNYLSQFSSKKIQKEFLIYLCDKVEHEGGVMIHPDSLQHNQTCYLSQFYAPKGLKWGVNYIDNIEDIRELFLSSLPIKIQEIKTFNTKSKAGGIYSISLKTKYLNKEGFIEFLTYELRKESILLEKTSDQVFYSFLSGENIFSKQFKIYFSEDTHLISQFIERILNLILEKKINETALKNSGNVFIGNTLFSINVIQKARGTFKSSFNKENVNQRFIEIDKLIDLIVNKVENFKELKISDKETVIKRIEALKK